MKYIYKILVELSLFLTGKQRTTGACVDCGIADFDPEALQRKCGFCGEDVWHILHKKDEADQ